MKSCLFRQLSSKCSLFHILEFPISVKTLICLLVIRMYCNLMDLGRLQGRLNLHISASGSTLCVLKDVFRHCFTISVLVK